MELSAELFEQTIRSFNGDGVCDRKQRRAQPRVGVRCRLKIIIVEAGVPGDEVEVWTRDISRAGIGIISSELMTIGSRFIVRFPRAADEPSLAMICTVRCCNQLSRGVFAIGAVFEGIEKSTSAAA